MKDALAAFEALRRTPDFFRRYLARYLAHADLGASAALADTKSHVFNDANFVNVWNGLLPADREPLRLAVVGITDIFSAPSRRRLGKMLGVGTSRQQKCAATVAASAAGHGLVLRMDYGDYRVQDDAFAEWQRNHDLEI